MLDTARVLWSFWYLRGVTAALAMFALIPRILDLSGLDIARVFVAIMNSLSAFFAAIGSWIGKIPLMPELSEEQVLYLTLILAVCVPAVLSGTKDIQTIRNSTSTAKERRVARMELRRLRTEREGLDGRTKIARRLKKLISNEEARLERLERLAKDGAIREPSLMLLAAVIPLIVMLVAIAKPNWIPPLFNFPIIFLSLSVAYTLACRLRGYATGTISVLGFFATMYILYWANNPDILEFVRSWAKEAV